MKIEDSHIELFDRYLRHELSVQELSAFNENLESDADFKARFEQYLLMTEGVKAYEREQLKAFMQENKSLMKADKPINPRRFLLAAASVVLILGTGLIINLSIRRNAESSLAIENNPALSESPQLQPGAALDSAGMADTAPVKIERATERFSEMVTVEKDKAVDEPPISENNGISDNAPLNGSYDMDVNVATDVLVKDTAVYPILLAYVEDLKDKPGTTDKFSSTETVTPSNAKKKYLPYNNNSNVGAPSVSSKAEVDRNAVKEKQDSGSTLKKAESKKVNAQVKLKVQYWRSPVNFKGYSYKNNTLLLYGLEPANTRIFQIGDKVYVSVNSMVYVIEPCETSCAFKQETDNNILQLITGH